MISSSSSEASGGRRSRKEAPPSEDLQQTRIAHALLPLLRAALGRVDLCEMTDACGFYLDGVLFGLVSGGQLHFRVDAGNRADYDAWERETASQDFFAAPQTTGGLKFRAVPPFVLDDEAVLVTWGRKAFEAAKRARQAAG